MQWEIEPHLSRCCGARVLSSTTEEAAAYRCSSCSKDGILASICYCGMTAGSSKRDAGLRCRPNPTRSKINPAEIVVVALSRLDAAMK